MCSSRPTSDRVARQQLDGPLAQVVGGACRGTGTPRDRGRYRARRCTHRHADRPSDRRATSRPRPTRRRTAPPAYAVDDRVVERAVLQHRPQVQRRAVGDVDERGVAGELGDGVCFGVAAVDDLEADDLGAQRRRTTRSRARRPGRDARTRRRPAARGPRRRPRARAAPGRGRGTAPATRRRRGARASRSSSWGRPRRRILRAVAAALRAGVVARPMRLAARRYSSVTFPPSRGWAGRRGGHGGQARRNRGFGDHGLRHRRGRGEERLRGRAAQPRPAVGRRDGRRASRSRWPSRSTGASSKRPTATPSLGRVRAVADLGELADCDLVIESIVEDLATKKHALHRPRSHLPRAHDPRDEHVDAAGRRDGDGHRPPRQGVRRPLLQPGADDGARRDRACDHVVGRHDRRRDRVRDDLRQERRCRSRTRPASSSTRCCSRT